MNFTILIKALGVERPGHKYIKKIGTHYFYTQDEIDKFKLVKKTDGFFYMGDTKVTNDPNKAKIFEEKVKEGKSANTPTLKTGVKVQIKPGAKGSMGRGIVGKIKEIEDGVARVMDEAGKIFRVPASSLVYAKSMWTVQAELLKAERICVISPLAIVLEKGTKLPDGTTRTWKGKQYIKQAGKWKEKAKGKASGKADGDKRGPGLSFKPPNDLREMTPEQNREYVDYLKKNYTHEEIKTRMGKIKDLQAQHKEGSAQHNNLQHNHNLHKHAHGEVQKEVDDYWDSHGANDHKGAGLALGKSKSMRLLKASSGGAFIPVGVTEEQVNFKHKRHQDTGKNLLDEVGDRKPRKKGVRIKVDRISGQMVTENAGGWKHEVGY